MKLSQRLLMDISSHLTPYPSPSGMSMTSRLHEENWRTGGVLTWFLMSDHYETFTDSSAGCSLLSNTISRSIRNNHLLLDFRKRLGGQGKT